MKGRLDKLSAIAGRCVPTRSYVGGTCPRKTMRAGGGEALAVGVKLTRCLGGPEASMPGSHCLTRSGGWAAIFCVLPSSPARRKWPTGVCRFLGQSLSGLFIKQVERLIVELGFEGR